MVNPGQRVRERLRELTGARAIVLKKVVGHALSGSWTDTRQRAQRLDEPVETLGALNGVAHHGVRTAA